jgi:hypothetical protein
MTTAPAGLSRAGARLGPVRALLPAAIAALTTARGTLSVLAWLAVMLIRQSRAARRERARQRARR